MVDPTGGLSRRSFLKSAVPLASAMSVGALSIFPVPAKSEPLAPASAINLLFDAFWDGDKIGTHQVVVEPGGRSGDWRSHVAIDMKVDLGLFGDITFASESIETWRDGRLVALSSETDNDGEKFSVTGEARDNGFAMQGPGGPVIAPANLLTTNSAWSVAVCQQKQLIDVTHGEVIGLVAKAKGSAQIEARGRTLKVQRFAVMSPLIAGELLYDPNGYWLGGTIERSGASINYVLQS